MLKLNVNSYKDFVLRIRRTLYNDKCCCKYISGNWFNIDGKIRNYGYKLYRLYYFSASNCVLDVITGAIIQIITMNKNKKERNIL